LHVSQWERRDRHHQANDADQRSQRSKQEFHGMSPAAKRRKWPLDFCARCGEVSQCL
jgi:hypothetical protein